MMKWRVRRDSHCASIEHEDIRRSLEVLDSVLAEFDDCLESWDSPPLYKRDSIEKYDSNQNLANYEKTCNRLSAQDPFSCVTYSRDGSTSHISSIGNVPEQPRVASPPPIPKRSPTTKLSEKNRNFFSFPSSDDTSLDSYESCAVQSDNNARLSSTPNGVVQQQIRALSSYPKENRDSTHPSNAEGIPESDKCENCGRGMKQKAVPMEPPGPKDTSPFLQRRQMFEAKIAEAAAQPSLNRSYGSSFRHKKPNETGNASGPASLPTSFSLESGIVKESQPGGTSEERAHKSLPNQISTRENVVSSQCHVPNCTCRQKIQELNARFSETRRLLKLKKIKGLDAEPPSFVAPPPLPTKKNQRMQNRFAEDSKPTTNGDLPMSTGENAPNAVNHPSEQNSEMSSSQSLDTSSRELALSRDTSWGTGGSPKLCNRCSAHLSDTIEDLPHLLPTDTLNRPQLGLCYSLEEDLSPGVKEIQQTSTPKSNVSSPSLFRTKESSLSTFSHSASSLGYVSSQSDLELNNYSNVPDKVPVTSFRSMTLPNGLERSPFYSPVDDVQSNFEQISSASEKSDYNDNRLPKDPHLNTMSSVELHLRSSSAPPPPEKTKKKHFRAFSRKSKKDKNKNGTTP